MTRLVAWSVVVSPVAPQMEHQGCAFRLARE
jgi:hypothetical protein